MSAGVPSVGLLVVLVIGLLLVLGIVILLAVILRSGSGKGSLPPVGPWRDDAEVARLLREGKKIEAIKLVRNRYRMGLKEAKECVEAIEAGFN